MRYVLYICQSLSAWLVPHRFGVPLGDVWTSFYDKVKEVKDRSFRCDS